MDRQFEVTATRLAQRCLLDPRIQPTITDRAPEKGLTHAPGQGKIQLALEPLTQGVQGFNLTTAPVTPPQQPGAFSFRSPFMVFPTSSAFVQPPRTPSTELPECFEPRLRSP